MNTSEAAARPMTGSPAADPAAAYRQPAEAVIAALGTDGRRGLEEAEAAARLERHGRNELTAQAPVPWWRRFLAQFEDVLVILLLVATAISLALWFFERDAALPYEAIAIFAVVLLNATIGYLQEARAEAAVAALRAMSAAGARVVRGGERRNVPAADLVPGDVILIEEGDTIPSDARLIESAALQTAEAALTGESLPVAKDTQPDRRRGGARRSSQHGVQRHRGHLRARQGGCDGDRHADRDGAHRGTAGEDGRRGHAAATGARPHGKDPRHRRRGDCRRHDRRPSCSSRMSREWRRCSTC